jgi:hypothetical protein
MHQPSLTQLLEQVLTGLVERLACGAATLAVEDNTEVTGKVIRVLPEKRLAAPIEVHVPEGERSIFVVLGRDSTLELQNAAEDASQTSSRVEDVCASVIEGRFREILWEEGGKIMRSRGELALSAGTLILGRQHATAGSRSEGEARVVDYVPYCARSARPEETVEDL